MYYQFENIYIKIIENYTLRSDIAWNSVTRPMLVLRWYSNVSLQTICQPYFDGSEEMSLYGRFAISSNG